MSVSISVITPSFRQGEFIERTIKSVLSQGLLPHHFEYVVCDGGSDDETVEVLKRYEGRLRWISEPDNGQADAVNKGISMTNGEIIAWLNSDDVYYPETLSRIQTFFDTHPEVDVVYGDADYIDEYDNFLSAYPTKLWNYKRLKRDNFLCQPSVFFRRTLIDQYGYLEVERHFSLDYELWLRFGQKTDFHYLPEKLSASRMYRQNKSLGQRIEANYEVNDMLRQKFGAPPDEWVFYYVKAKVEEEFGLEPGQPLQTRSQVNAFTLYSLAAFWRWKRYRSVGLLKVLIRFLLPTSLFYRLEKVVGSSSAYQRLKLRCSSTTPTHQQS